MASSRVFFFFQRKQRAHTGQQHNLRTQIPIKGGSWGTIQPAFRRHIFMSHTSRQLLVCGSNTSTVFLTSGPSWPPAAYSWPPSTPTPVQEPNSTVSSQHSQSGLQPHEAANLHPGGAMIQTGHQWGLFHQRTWALGYWLPVGWGCGSLSGSLSHRLWKIRFT